MQYIGIEERLCELTDNTHADPDHREPLGLASAAGIGWKNCICAELLPGTRSISTREVLALLSRWASAAGRYTRDAERHWSSQPNNRDSHAIFLVLCLVTFVERGLGVKYDFAAIGSSSFKDATTDFLPGVVVHRLATCASFPVLYVALGRRLGYPMHLAIAKGHVFAKWISADSGEHFNIDAVGHGLNTPPDEYYLTWPRPLTSRDLATGEFLRPLGPQEELSLFLCTRGHCLADNGRLDEALAVYEAANRLWPRPDAHASFVQELDLKRTANVKRTYANQ
jgi:hypothetical protein